jgi:5-methylcytosine-specific restriction protein A
MRNTPRYKRNRRLTLVRDGYRCRNCGSTAALTVDHITPLSAGGTNDLENLWTLCDEPCHRLKTKQDVEMHG